MPASCAAAKTGIIDVPLRLLMLLEAEGEHDEEVVCRQPAEHEQDEVQRDHALAGERDNAEHLHGGWQPRNVGRLRGGLVALFDVWKVESSPVPAGPG